jgi:hypothetical protein
MSPCATRPVHSPSLKEIFANDLDRAGGVRPV